MIYNQDCSYQLQKLEENSIDSLVTDPPAGISFMGKEWDSDKGGRDNWVKWFSEIMRECLRVMKPGAHGLVWAIPRTSHWTATAIENAGFEVRDVVTHLFGSGFPKSLNVEKAGAGAEWRGFGTALKPASEHWILVRKPCSEKTVAKNVVRWGTGALNIDGGRTEGITSGSGTAFKTNGTMGNFKEKRLGVPNIISNQGRFPANLIFSHSPYCSDTQCDIECAIKMLDEQSGLIRTRNGYGVKGQTGGGTGAAYQMTKCDASISRKVIREEENGVLAGASRFFYCAKVSGKERGEGNNHPTVKAQKLMQYLIKLITPPNGTVLDPFMGSGSTGIAAKREGFKFIGIEKEKEYFEIAERRIEASL